MATVMMTGLMPDYIVEPAKGPIGTDSTAPVPQDATQDVGQEPAAENQAAMNGGTLQPACS